MFVKQLGSLNKKSSNLKRLGRFASVSLGLRRRGWWSGEVVGRVVMQALGKRILH